MSPIAVGIYGGCYGWGYGWVAAGNYAGLQERDILDVRVSRPPSARIGGNLGN